MERINTHQLITMMEQQNNVPLINVLPNQQHEEEHIPGSQSIPVSTEDFSSRVESLVGSKEQPVVVYCADTSCNASEKAAERLESSGFAKVYDYAGGVAEWRAAGNQIASGRGDV